MVQSQQSCALIGREDPRKMFKGGTLTVFDQMIMPTQEVNKEAVTLLDGSSHVRGLKGALIKTRCREQIIIR